MRGITSGGRRIGHIIAMAIGITTFGRVGITSVRNKPTKPTKPTEPLCQGSPYLPLCLCVSVSGHICQRERGDGAAQGAIT